MTEPEPTFLALREAYINPRAIRWVELRDGFIEISLEGKDRSIGVEGADADTILAYCKQQGWTLLEVAQ